MIKARRTTAFRLYWLPLLVTYSDKTLPVMQPELRSVRAVEFGMYFRRMRWTISKNLEINKMMGSQLHLRVVVFLECNYYKYTSLARLQR